MQGTIVSFDAEEGGVLVLDDGVTMPYGRDVVAASPVRHLRLGQRVIVETSGPDGTITALRIH